MLIVLGDNHPKLNCEDHMEGGHKHVVTDVKAWVHQCKGLEERLVLSEFIPFGVCSLCDCVYA